MRHALISALLAAALLAGCESTSTPPAPTAPPTAPIANAVSGTLMLRDPRQLGSGAHADIRVIDVAQPSVILAQTSISPVNQLPISFNLPIDASKVDPKRTYAVEAVLVDGDRRYMPVLQYPVLTNKAPAKVDVIVAPEPTPAEKMYEEFKKAFGQIGSLKQISGTGETDKTTTAWDAFLSNGKVRVVRETTSLYDDKANETGRIKWKITYQNDKPWVVVRDEGGVSTRVGWDESGQLVLKEKIANGQSSDASAEEAKAIYDHAMQAFNTAQARAPRK